MLNKKTTDFYFQVYKKDLKFPIEKYLHDKLKDVKEFFHVYHDDVSDVHYHVFIKFKKPTIKESVKKIFHGINFFVSDIPKSETFLSVLYFLSYGFRLPITSSYNITTKIINQRRL